jgi:hypothetical protein
MANSVSLNSCTAQSFLEGPPIAFDDTLINVPEAQAQACYDNYETIDDKLGFTNPFDSYIPSPPPHPSDPILIAQKHNPDKFYSRAISRIQMEDLDNGTGRMVPSKKLLPSKPRLYSDTRARTQAIEEGRLSRLYDDANPRRVERAYHAAPPTYYSKIDEKAGLLHVVSVDPYLQGGPPRASRLSDSDTESDFDIEMSGLDAEPITTSAPDHYVQFVIPQTAIRGPPSPGVPLTVDPLDLDPTVRSKAAYRRFVGPLLSSHCNKSFICKVGPTERRRNIGASTKKRAAFDPISIETRTNFKSAAHGVTYLALSSNKTTSGGRNKKGSEVY